MSNTYLTLIKWLTYLYLIYIVINIVLFVALGFFNYDNRFIGCRDGSCSFLWSFAEDEGPYRIHEDIGDGRLVVRDLTKEELDRRLLEKSDEVVKEIHPLLNGLIILYHFVVGYLIILALKVIRKVENLGVFYESVSQSIKRIVKGLIIVILFREVISIVVDIYTDNRMNVLSINSEFLFKMFMILLVLLITQIINEGVRLRRENDLTI